jgi:exonuclease SbcC
VRPTRLELEGFASFRAPTTVDFAGADLFVLFGPTGAGKSSLIDALTFALYGSVPRYADRRLVAPVISQGLNEARVRFDFTADGAAYTAVRVVRRTQAGATTKEARLVSGEAVLAASADELTARVERLLGLTFEHFTRCVVLPQGEFAEFLHAKPAERQELLIRLLGLDLYDRVRGRAVERQQAGEAGARQIEGLLASGLGDATAEAVAAAEARADALDALLASLDARRPELERLVAVRADAVAAVAEAESRAAALAGTRPPADLDALVARLAAGDTAVRAAERAVADAAAAREAAETRRAALPERAALEAARAVHAERASVAERVAAAATMLRDAAVAERAAAAALADGEAAYAAAADAYAAVQRARAAAHLAQHLRAGEPCPVCRQPVTDLPDHPPPPELAAARAAESRAASARDAARAEHERCGRRRELAEAELARLRGEAATLEARVAAVPAPDVVEARLVELEEAEQALVRAREAEKAARTAAERVAGDARRLDAERAAAWRAFDDARDARNRLGLEPGPPPPGRTDLRADWAALVAWAADRAEAQRAVIAARRADIEVAERALERIIEEQRAACAGQGVIVPRDRVPRDVAADARADARAAARRLAEQHAMADRLRRELAEQQAAARVAKELARLLDARNFKNWLIRRAMGRLVAGATGILRTLSDGAYSLELDARNEFLVIDHNNADDRRMARTLSGGETFLASLALALALAGQVAEMSDAGGARLETLFLDEGFGTLDAATLDTVATAIEELGARGRTVGLVTHVRDLAERVPVRFEVRREARGSVVERVGG